MCLTSPLGETEYNPSRLTPHKRKIKKRNHDSPKRKNGKLGAPNCANWAVSPAFANAVLDQKQLVEGLKVVFALIYFAVCLVSARHRHNLCRNGTPRSEERDGQRTHAPERPPKLSLACRKAAKKSGKWVCCHASRIRPMRLRLVKEPFDHPDYIFKVKHDGLPRGQFSRPLW
jgi:hypothetical protein